jgi:phospholipid/cholesterol/gamma-HCH transport system ATP-binding protein
MIDIINLSFSHEDRVILHDINMQVKEGSITAILGSSGCGKTTLLRLMGGLLVPDYGDVRVGSNILSALSVEELHLARRSMGFLFQNSALFTHLSVFDNVAFPLREHTNLPESMIRTMVLLKLEAVGLRGAIDLMPAELSGGMARRVAIARALALDPRVMLFDEPFTGQDPISVAVLIKLIKRFNQLLRTTTVIVSHDVAEICELADYIYVLAQGKIMGHGSPEQLLSSDSLYIRQFMKGDADGIVPFHYPAKFYDEDLLGL